MDTHDIILYDYRTLEGMSDIGEQVINFFKWLLCCEKEE